ncbi:MAG: ROK family protein [Planctomycetota bacterium]|nr:ROK family protein [Planctomycetota bacterium]
MSTLGIDIGASSVKVALLRDGVVAAVGQSDRYANPDAAQVGDAIRAGVAALGQATARVTAAGVCVPGALDPAGLSLTASVNMPGLVGQRLDAVLERALAFLPQRFTITTDAHAAAYDAWALHKPPGRMVALSVGTGVGAAVLDEGALLRVTGPSSGHIGQLDVSVPEPGRPIPTGPDGGVGSLEAYIGSAALHSRYGPEMSTRLANLSPEDAPLQALVRALRIIHAIYRPNSIWFLGGHGLRMAPSARVIFEATSRGLTRLARPGWTLNFGTSLHHAASGAARLAEAAASPSKEPPSERPPKLPELSVLPGNG